MNVCVQMHIYQNRYTIYEVQNAIERTEGNLTILDMKPNAIFQIKAIQGYKIPNKQ